jgi:hypothetical protein
VHRVAKVEGQVVADPSLGIGPVLLGLAGPRSFRPSPFDAFVGCLACLLVGALRHPGVMSLTPVLLLVWKLLKISTASTSS